MANSYRSVLQSTGPAPTGGDAVASEVLSGKTFTNDNGQQTGTMPNRGAVSETINLGQSYTVPEGYHNGNGTVTATGDSYVTTTTTMPQAIVNRGYIDGLTTDEWKIKGFKFIDYTLAAYASDRVVAIYIDNTLIQSASNSVTVSNYEITPGLHTIKITAQYPGSGTPKLSGFTPHN